MNLDKLCFDLPAELGIIGRQPEYKLVKLYAYNAYFNADPLRTEDVNNGFLFSRERKFNIDGIYINENLEENTIECLYAIYCGNAPLSIQEVLQALDYISAQINDVKKRHFTGDKNTETLLGDYLNESDNKKVTIKILTDYTPDEAEKYDLVKRITNHYISVLGIDLDATICFGDDIETTVDQNVAPYEYVLEGKMVVDNPKNILKFKDNSFICNISAQSLKQLWKKEGHRGLLAMNLRYFVKNAAIDEKIENSIMFGYDDFWYLNNGIIVVCNDYSFVGNELRLKEFSIVNGGQTTNKIGTIPFNHDFFISCKVVKNNFETTADKNLFISKVAEASNTQKPIKAKDIIANRVEQRNLKTLLTEKGIFIEIKRGEKCDKNVYKEPWQRTKNNELAQDLYSFVFMEPGPSRNNVSSMLQNQDKYSTIFKNHSYSFEFLRDVIKLEKCYKEYQKFISKADDENADGVKKGLVKNGLFYCLATIGYILKLCYNSEFVKEMQKNRNNESMFNIYSSEPAFNHGFIPENMDYKTYKEHAYDLFDFIFRQFIIPQFELARHNNKSIAYSNWTKTNTGFDGIRTNINFFLYDRKETAYIQNVKKYFVSIDQEQKNSNIDNYVDYCKANKKIKAKDRLGNELNENDEALRNELMIYRLEYSSKKHIAESKVYTDKGLDRIVTEKPISKEGLKKIVGADTTYFCGDDLLAIINKYL